MPSYQLTPASLRRLDGVHRNLQKVILRAHQMLDEKPPATHVTFQISETIRTLERQKELVARGASKTLDSRHLASPVDGLSRAADLVAVEADGDVSWQWADYFTIADAMRLAAIECGVRVRWGGGWFIINDANDLHEAQAAYIARKQARKQKPFLDGPHFELPKDLYP